MTYAPTAGVERPLIVLTVCPNAVLVWLALVGLFLEPWLGSMAVLLFLAAGMALFVRAPAETVGALLVSWWILCLPLWGIASFGWSDHPGISLRAGIQFGLSVVIAIAMASRVSPQTLLKATFFAALLAALASIAFGRARLDGGGYLGIYGSKNALALAMVLFLCAATALAIGRETGRFLRVFASVGVAMAFTLIVLAQSLGWLIAGGVVLVIGVAAVVLRIVDIRLRFLTVGLLVLATGSLAQFVFIHQETFLNLFSEATGKDPTLTGRTELWAVAREQIAAAELLGHGYQAFWVHGNPVAEDLWREFGIASRSGFRFHSTWLTTWVEIGAIGVALQAIVVVRALYGSLGRALMRMRSESFFFAALLVVTVAMSMGEDLVFLQFDALSVLVIAAAVFAIRARREAVAAKMARA